MVYKIVKVTPITSIVPEYFTSQFCMGKSPISRHHNGMISAKDIMHKYNISYNAVNHYTDFGLLSLAYKKGNVRFYDEHQVSSRLTMITKLSREGYSLRLIRKKILGV